MTMKLHLAVQKTGKFPDGAEYTRTYTLCGRENAASTDGTNSTSVESEVTCGHCRRMMRAPWFAKRRAKEAA